MNAQFDFIRPQLAHAPIEGMLDRHDLLDDYIVEMKIDGHRVHIAHHLDGTVSIWSRTGKVNGWPGWLHDLARHWPVGTYIDAELFPHPERFSKDTPFTSADVTHLRAENPDALQVFLIDVLYLDSVMYLDKPYHARLKVVDEAWMCGILNGFEDHVALPAHLAKYGILSMSPRGFLKRALSVGHEGVIVKKRDGVYRPNSRSKDWSKYKATRECDVLIVGMEAIPNPWRVRPGKVGTDGTLHPYGLLSSPAREGHQVLSYGYMDQGEMIRIGTVGMSGPPEKIKQHIGKVGTFKVYGVFPSSGALRHPVFIQWRDDIDAHEISMGSIVNGW